MNNTFFITFRSLVKSQWHFKRATGAKPDVASVWPMPCALMTSKRGENDRYWCILGMQEVGIKYYNISKTCHHTQVDSFVTFWGCAQSKEAPQDHWLVDYFTVSAFGAYTIVTKMQVGQVATREQYIRRVRGQARVRIHLYSLNHRIRAILQTEDSRMPYQRYHCILCQFLHIPE